MAKKRGGNVVENDSSTRDFVLRRFVFNEKSSMNENVIGVLVETPDTIIMAEMTVPPTMQDPSSIDTRWQELETIVTQMLRDGGWMS